MTFLTGLLSSIGVSLLSALGGWLLHYFQVAAADAAAKKAADAATQSAVDADKAAATPGDRDNAAKGIADNL